MLCLMPARPKNSKKQQLGLFGVGLDNDDGHQRITQGRDFYVVGGSAETHERMQDLVLRMNATLKSKGKRFVDLSAPEFEDLARDSFE